MRNAGCKCSQEKACKGVPACTEVLGGCVDECCTSSCLTALDFRRDNASIMMSCAQVADRDGQAGTRLLGMLAQLLAHGPPGASGQGSSTQQALTQNAPAQAKESGSTATTATQHKQYRQQLAASIGSALAAKPRHPALGAALLHIALKARCTGLGAGVVQRAAEVSGALQAGALQLEEQLLQIQPGLGSSNTGTTTAGLAAGGGPVAAAGGAPGAAGVWEALATLYQGLEDEEVVAAVRTSHLAKCAGALAFSCLYVFVPG